MQCYLTRGPFGDVYDAASSRRKLCPADQHFFDLINQGASCGDLLSAVQSGANINAAIYSVSDEGNDGFYFDGNLTLLQSLCEEEEDPEIIRFLIEDCGADINLACAVGGNTPLHLAIANRDVKMALFLISLGAKLNLENDEGSTPLNFAKMVGDPGLIRRLILAGADPSLKTEVWDEIRYREIPFNLYAQAFHSFEDSEAQWAGRRALDRRLFCAIHDQTCTEVEEALMDGANVNATINIPVGIKFCSNDGDDEDEVEEEEEEEQMTMEVSPLCLAVTCVGFDGGDESKILTLLNAGADIEAFPKIESCGSPLYQAATWGNIPSMCLLIAKGADVNSKSYGDNMTPLMAAAKGNLSGVMRILLGAGADPAVLGGPGNDETALDIASCSRFGTCKHLLSLAMMGQSPTKS